MTIEKVRSTAERFVAGEGLGLGNPLTVNPPPVEEPVDFTNRGPRPKTAKRPPGEKGRGPVQTLGDQADKSPSEQVAPTGEGGDLKDNPFDNGAKPSKLNKKKGAGNPGEQGDPQFKENLWVPAKTTQEAFAAWFHASYGAHWRLRP